MRVTGGKVKRGGKLGAEWEGPLQRKGRVATLITLCTRTMVVN